KKYAAAAEAELRDAAHQHGAMGKDDQRYGHIDCESRRIATLVQIRRNVYRVFSFFHQWPAGAKAKSGPGVSDCPRAPRDCRAVADHPRAPATGRIDTRRSWSPTTRYTN